MLDENIPLTTNEFDEWGNPNNHDAYLYMKSYSPYENIEYKNYPNMLVSTGLHDSQVQYFEPAKWVAKLRAMKKDNNILLLHTNMEFGHGGASGRFDYLMTSLLIMHSCSVSKGFIHCLLIQILINFLLITNFM
jgi:oligopeptidase B